ncbi:hypothetical protein [Acetobacter peroxydans]|jgi:hypothetical protein|uniref:hypothetical protein n=1 Tax=Acetobacter peroxydans TaxID=104098 RepID=UPI002352243A|nr:hypothetical protein [Acetobacter peroxydans]MCH4142639.1 hypothetical protein [Acetobacter peroxydans]MCI1394591.1 hypothetical protein [Acetobacter peroxydans]MCI1410369.1 hypothetical protein [Acetobacter peroxydans]MCI1440800.1 hypothetical protein [Acetobacter peroxydans]MCI1565730.1 hypothetical protein [Acetobacter peroxydans]
MSRLTTEERNALPDSAFALPGRRYPIHDAAHARDALARASEMLHRGELTQDEYDTVHRKAEAVLHHEGS